MVFAFNTVELMFVEFVNGLLQPNHNETTIVYIILSSMKKRWHLVPFQAKNFHMRTHGKHCELALDENFEELNTSIFWVQKCIL